METKDSISDVQCSTQVCINHVKICTTFIGHETKTQIFIYQVMTHYVQNFIIDIQRS